MNPYDRILAAYPNEQGEFKECVEYHERHGFVFATPDYFVMGRPVVMMARADQICDYTCEFPAQGCDCWYIHAMAGHLAQVWDVLPWELPWIAWQRVRDPEKVLRIYPLARMRSMSLQRNASNT